MGLDMRISTLRDDPCYDGMAPYEVCNVLLNGRVVRDCVTADEEIGMVTYVARDEKGRVRHEGGELVLRRDVGKVEIVFRQLRHVPLA